MSKSQIFNVRTKVFEVFSLDPRSLALFRILLGSAWLLELIVRLSEVKAYYTDFGILPRSISLNQFPKTAPYSFLHLSDSLAFQIIVFGIAILCAIGIILGYKTKFMTFLTWFFCISIQSRNEMILYGADHLFRVLLFWSIFLPMDRVWSLEQKVLSKNKKIFSIWTVAILLQICYFYFFGGVLKSGDAWRQTGAALYLAFQYDQLTGDLGRYLLNFPALLKIGSLSIYYFEIFISLFLLSPLWNPKIRTGATICLLIFHGMIALTMALYLIPIVNMIALILFLPSEFWDRFHKIKYQIQGTLIKFHLSFVLGIFAIFYCFVWNLSTVYPHLEEKIPFKNLGYILRLDQNWGFYAPHPFLYDGWWLYPGKTIQGEEVDAWSLKFNPPSIEKPKKVADIFINDNFLSRFNAHWMAHSILSNDAVENHKLTLQYLCRRWNSLYNEDRSLKEISLIYMEEITQMKPEQIEVRPRPLLSISCH